jgi:hypothetical protein
MRLYGECCRIWNKEKTPLQLSYYQLITLNNGAEIYQSIVINIISVFVTVGAVIIGLVVVGLILLNVLQLKRNFKKLKEL